MSDSDPPHEANTEFNESLESRVSSLLERRAAFAPALAAYAAELPPGPYRRDVKKTVANLNTQDSAEQICRSAERTASLLPLLAAGTQPGEQIDRLHHVFSESERDAELGRQRQRVLLYPAVVGLIAIAVLLFLCVTVTPVFDDVFTSFELELPSLTEGVLRLSRVIRFQPIAVLLVVLAAAAAVILAASLVTHGWFESVFGLVGGGSSRELLAIATFTRRVADGLAADLPLPVALRLAGQATKGRSIRAAADALADEVEVDPKEFEQSAAARRFPAVLTQALAEFQADEPAPNRTVDLLHELALIYAERVQRRFDWSTGIIAQFAIVFVGLLVGLVLLSLLMPLVSLVNGLS